MTLKIDFKWIDAGPSADKLAEATMAELSIAVDGVAVTSHIDRRTHSHGDAITVPLYPLAEWVTSWWFPLFHEYGEWGVGEAPDFLIRHDMAQAGCGFVYPGLLLRPTGSYLDVRTLALPRQHSSIEYVASVQTQIPIEAAQSALSTLIEAVIERLRSAGITGSAVEQDWEAIGGLNSDEMAFCDSAGRFGLDPFDLSDSEAELITRLAAAAPPELVDDLFSLGEPKLVESLLEPIQDAAGRAREAGAGAAWKKLTRVSPPSMPDWRPWQTGYACARQARDELGLDGQPVEFDGALSVGMMSLPIEAARLIGVVASDSPACAIGSSSLTARRFALARSVGDFLMREAPQMSLLTSMSSDRQSRNRSFAAEFLAPSEGIRRRLGARAGGWIDQDTIDELATEYAVSSFVVAHQIRNHGLGRVEF